MSRALARLLRAGGHMAFQTIHPTPGLNAAQRRRAHRSGPWAVASTRSPYELLDRAGLVDIHVIDQTEDFRNVAAAWIEQWNEHRDELVALYGETDFETRHGDSRNQLQAIDDGVLQRSMAVGRVPLEQLLDETDSASHY
ncbi:MAG TPA: hypothetical protein VFD53_09625 [Ilumatobacter sp.]|nr:hypothetical protein [Ilumatobacter sp.]